LLARGREPQRPVIIEIPAALALGHEPRADCHRYNQLLRSTPDANS
jgi:hypothetical protein